MNPRARTRLHNPACSAFPRAVAVLDIAMSAFCRAILDARCAAFTAESILSRNLAERMRNRCFFLLEVIRMLFLSFPPSLVPSLKVVTPYPYFLLLNHSPSYFSPSDRSLIPKPHLLSFFHSSPPPW